MGEILLFGVDFDPLDTRVNPEFYEHSAEAKLSRIVSSLEAFYLGSKFHEIIERKN